MNNNTHIFNRWQGYKLADLACEYCLYYIGDENPCPLESCICQEEREEAFQREYGDSLEELSCRE